MCAMPSSGPSDVIRVGQIEIRFLLEPEQTAGSQTMFEFLVPSKARVPIAHSHDAYDETVYGLEGAMTWMLDGRTVRVGPGDVLFIPRGKVHKFENVDAADARALAVITPGLLGPDFFREVAAVLAAGGPPNLALIGEIMRRHGLTPAP